MGSREEDKIVCPSNSAMFDCPYYKNGYCKMLEKEGVRPDEECDDYGFYLAEIGDKEDE